MFKKIQNIETISEDKIGKVTGMLIDLDILDLEEIIEILVNE